MEKLRAWIVTFEDKTEHLYLMETELFSTAEHVVARLRDVWQLPAVSATCQVPNLRCQEINEAVKNMIDALYVI